MKFSVSLASRWLVSGCLLAPGLMPCQAQAPSADAAAAMPASVAAPAAPPRFDVLEFQVEGNTVLDNERIERAVYPFLGEGRTIDDVESARAALEQVYRQGGYGTVSVDIPEQKVTGGLVVLNVVEGRVSRLRVQGSRYFSQDRILAAVPALAEGSVPHFPDVQKQLVAVNNSLDKRVTPLLRPGKQAGTTEVDLQVEDQRPFHGSVEVNNQNAPNTSATRVMASLRYSNLFQLDHTAGVQFQMSPQNTDEVKVIAANYSIPAGSGTLVFSAVHSDSSSYVGGGIGVFGKGDVFGLRYLIPLEASESSPGLQQSLSLGVDYKHFNQDLAVASNTGIRTPIQYVPFSINYSGALSDESGVTEFGLGLGFTFRGLASQRQQFADKRYQALSNFALLTFNLARTQKLPKDCSLYAALAGQASGQPLVSNEHMVVGGADTVRGYLESSQAGDTGLRGTLELRTPNLGPAESRIELLQARAFFDAAHLLLRSPLPGSRDTYQLASVGTGVTLKVSNGFNLKADLAWPLRDTNYQKAYEPRLHASASYEF